MKRRFETFLDMSLWLSALMTLLYHFRFLMLVDYAALREKTRIDQVFYFLTGLGHESFAVFFVVNGICAGLFLRNTMPALGELTLLGRWWRSHLALLPVLVAGGLLDLIGAYFFNGSGLYSDFPAFSTVTLSWSAFFGNLFMLQPALVPTFGSNGMLYLYAYLWWSCCLLALTRRAWRSGKPWNMAIGAALVLALAGWMPPTFWPWLTIWLLGVAVGLRGPWPRPLLHPLAAWGLLATAIVFSRLAGARTDLLPAPWGQVLVLWKYVLVGLGFAAVASVLYRGPITPQANAAPSLLARANRHLADSASMAFLFHFPLMMLLTAIGADLCGHALMQQPGLLCYVLLGCAVTLCYAAGHALVRWIGAPFCGARPNG
ncbi:hypothetical protein LXA47_27040 [Massilia sp. P8910]|uniref:hypothetical protein n=1 Tax=Massilia antarctica TaxID=2765360 RepID=UPI001E3ED25D|nr:hypothetical protein [Massilia antarctica]MCE3607227.1 hypothetical protein [Massilia antarctica]